MADKMTAARAADVLGINRTQWDLRCMVRALAIHPWNNTADDEMRYAAAKWVVWHRRMCRADVRCIDRDGRDVTAVAITASIAW